MLFPVLQRLGVRIANEVLMYFRSQKKNAGELSLSDTIESDGDGEGLSLWDTLAEESDLTEDVSRKELHLQAVKSVDTLLQPREAEIIRMRYGLTGKEPLTQRETAQAMGISRSYVSGRG